MAIDLGSNPQAPNASPTDEERIQLRKSIASLNNSWTIGSSASKNFGSDSIIIGDHGTPIEATSGVTASSGTITKISHGLNDLDIIKFTFLNGGTGLSASITYHVRNKTDNTFQVSVGPTSPILTPDGYTDGNIQYIAKAHNYGTQSSITGQNNQSNTGSTCNIGGYNNYSNIGSYCLISGSSNYLNSGNYCSISGNFSHSNSGNYCSISGNSNFNNYGNYCLISGGNNTENSGEYCSIAGANNSGNSGYYCSIAGVNNSGNSGYYCSISGGNNGNNTGYYCLISGGNNTENSGEYCLISGGNNGNNSGYYCLISGGHNGNNSGEGCLIAGVNNSGNTGNYCSISGEYVLSNSHSFAHIIGGGYSARSIRLIIKTQTASSSQAELTFGGNEPTLNTKIQIKDSEHWLFTINIIANHLGIIGANSCSAFTRRGIAGRVGDVGNTFVAGVESIGSTLGSLSVSAPTIQADTTNGCLQILANPPAAIPATDMVAGGHYVIASVGNTVFTNFGASNGTVEEYFIATSAGTGTGTVYKVINWSATVDIIQTDGLI